MGNMLSGQLSRQENLGALIADYAGLRGIEAYKIEAACASGAAALRLAGDRRGRWDARYRRGLRRGKDDRQRRRGDDGGAGHARRTPTTRASTASPLWRSTRC